MRSTLGALARRSLAFFRRRGSGLVEALLLLAVNLGGGSMLAGGASASEMRQYSAYSDPEKPALFFIHSEEQNVE